MSEYRALYRKFRPYDFDDVVGQGAITDILKYEVQHDKLSHAYLFCGSRGTGKTSCAKILAKAVNCLSPKNGNPCCKCEACLSIDRGIATDVIEMDAASNNGVDNVRDLKDEIAFTPAQLKYRVYIIDEVHMMSASAFNALLKTLEEPPTYVIFILATTELHKLPSTIVSRCQRFDFKRLSTDALMSRLYHISEREGFTLTEDAARMIARGALGGMRDAISLLELCAGGGGVIDAEAVSAAVGAGGRELAYRMLSAIARASYDEIYATMRETVMKGADISVFLRDLIDAYRDLSVVKTCADAKAYLDLTDTEYETLRALAEQFSMSRIFYHTAILEAAGADIQRSAGAARSTAEIALTRLCDPKTAATAEAMLVRIEELEKQVAMLRLGVSATGGQTAPQPSPATPAPPPEQKAPLREPSVKDAPIAQKARASSPVTEGKPLPYKRWSRAVERIGEIKRPLSVQFINAAAYTADGRAFTVVMTPFFAKKLRASEGDVAILKGILAELEGCDAASIRLDIRDKGAGGEDPSEELERSFMS